MAYRCVATSVAGFIQQLAVGYVARGYYFYVTGRIPDHKDPAKTDQKIIGQYGIGISKRDRRVERKRDWLMSITSDMDAFFVLMANHGEQGFFAAEATQLRDVRVAPIHFMGYSIGCRRGRHMGVPCRRSIHQERLQELKVRFKQAAVHRSVEELCRALHAVPYEPYAPVRDQMPAWYGSQSTPQRGWAGASSNFSAQATAISGQALCPESGLNRLAPGSRRRQATSTLLILESNSSSDRQSARLVGGALLAHDNLEAVAEGQRKQVRGDLFDVKGV